MSTVKSGKVGDGNVDNPLSFSMDGRQPAASSSGAAVAAGIDLNDLELGGFTYSDDEGMGPGEKKERGRMLDVNMSSDIAGRPPTMRGPSPNHLQNIRVSPPPSAASPRPRRANASPVPRLPPADEPAPPTAVPVRVEPPLLFENPSCRPQPVPPQQAVPQAAPAAAASPEPTAVPAAEHQTSAISLQLADDADRYRFPASAPPPHAPMHADFFGSPSPDFERRGSGGSVSGRGAGKRHTKVHLGNASVIALGLLLCMLVLGGIVMTLVAVRLNSEVDDLERELDILRASQLEDKKTWRDDTERLIRKQMIAMQDQLGLRGVGGGAPADPDALASRVDALAARVAALDNATADLAIIRRDLEEVRQAVLYPPPADEPTDPAETADAARIRLLTLQQNHTRMAVDSLTLEVGRAKTNLERVERDVTANTAGVATVRKDLREVNTTLTREIENRGDGRRRPPRGGDDGAPSATALRELNVTLAGVVRTQQQTLRNIAMMNSRMDNMTAAFGAIVDPSSFRDLGSEVALVRRQLRNATATLAAEQVGIQLLKTTVSDAYDTVSEAEANATRAYADAAAKAAEVEDAVADYNDVRAQWVELNATAAEERAAIAAARRGVANITASVRDVRGQLDTALASSKEDMKGVENTTAAIRALRDDVVLQRERMRGVSNRVLAAQWDIEAIETRLNMSLGAAVEDLETIRDSHDDIALVRDTLRSLDRAVHSLNATVDAANAKLKAAENVLNASVVATVAQARDGVVSLTATVAALDDRFTGYSNATTDSVMKLNKTVAAVIENATARAERVNASILKLRTQLEDGVGYGGSGGALPVGGGMVAPEVDEIVDINATLYDVMARVDEIENITITLLKDSEQFRRADKDLQAQADRALNQVTQVNGTVAALSERVAEVRNSTKYNAAVARNNSRALQVGFDELADEMTRFKFATERQVVAVNETLSAYVEEHRDVIANESERVVREVVHDVVASLKASVEAAVADLEELRDGHSDTKIDVKDIVGLLTKQRVAMAALNASVTAVEGGLDSVESRMEDADRRVIGNTESVANLSVTVGELWDTATSHFMRLERELKDDIVRLDGELEEGLSQRAAATDAVNNRVTEANKQREAGDQFVNNRVSALDRAAASAIYSLARAISIYNQRAQQAVQQEAVARAALVQKTAVGINARVDNMIQALTDRDNNHHKAATQLIQELSSLFTTRFAALDGRVDGHDDDIEVATDDLLAVKRTTTRLKHVVDALPEAVDALSANALPELTWVVRQGPNGGVAEYNQAVRRVGVPCRAMGDVITSDPSAHARLGQAAGVVFGATWSTDGFGGRLVDAGYFAAAPGDGSTGRTLGVIATARNDVGDVVIGVRYGAKYGSAVVPLQRPGVVEGMAVHHNTTHMFVAGHVVAALDETAPASAFGDADSSALGYADGVVDFVVAFASAHTRAGVLAVAVADEMRVEPVVVVTNATALYRGRAVRAGAVITPDAAGADWALYVVCSLARGVLDVGRQWAAGASVRAAFPVADALLQGGTASVALSPTYDTPSVIDYANGLTDDLEFQCPPGEAMFRVWSDFNSFRRDRRWKFECVSYKAVVPTWV